MGMTSYDAGLGYVIVEIVNGHSEDGADSKESALRIDIDEIEISLIFIAELPVLGERVNRMLLNEASLLPACQ
jgi:hypothetical protein